LTWVIGVPTIGCGLLLGDIAVTDAATGQIEPYGLMKVHPLGNRAAVGFAGSVMIALELLPELQSFGASVSEAELLSALPHWVAGITRTYESRFPPSARALGLAMLVLAAQESRTDAGSLMGFSTVRGCRLTFPQTSGERPSAVELPHGKAASIGSGSQQHVYAARLDVAIGGSLIHTFENLAIGSAPYANFAYAKLAALRITETLQADPHHGISEQLIICVLGGPVRVFIDNQLPLDSDGKLQPGAPAAFPPIAHSLDELSQLRGQHGASHAPLIA